MSITYDSSKWSNPLHEWDTDITEPSGKPGKLVAVDELPFFRAYSSGKQKPFPFISSGDTPESSTTKRRFRKKVTHTKKK